MPICPNCKYESDSPFCPQCGTKMTVTVSDKPKTVSDKPKGNPKKTCPKCGAELNGAFCKSCGYYPNAKKSTTVSAPAPAVQPQNQIVGQYNPQPSKKKSNHSERKVTFYIVFFVLVIYFLAYIVGLILDDSHSPNKIDTQTVSNQPVENAEEYDGYDEDEYEDEYEDDVDVEPDYPEMYVWELDDELESNKLRFSEKYKDCVLEIKGQLRDVNSDGTSFHLDDFWASKIIYLDLDESKTEQRDKLMNLNDGDWVVVKFRYTGLNFFDYIEGNVIDINKYVSKNNSY